MRQFTIFPAIDLRQGKVVRLVQGDPNRQTIFSDDPAATAQNWWDAGASWLHVVNLDGAFEQPDLDNYHALQDILSASKSLPGKKIQLGGGLRNLKSVETALTAGCMRVVLGTSAVQTPQLVEEVIQAFGAEHVAVGIDVLDGKIRLRGWTVSADVDTMNFVLRLAEYGLETVIYTNVARDGTGSGVDIANAQKLQQGSGISVVGSGGVNTLGDIRQARLAGLVGVIIGRALYDGKFSLEEALRC